MSNGLLGNLLGQSSNATSGLFGGPSFFQQQPTRGQRRSALLSQAITSQGSNPYARLGAAFGGLIGMGGRAAAEGLGIVDEPPQVRQARVIREAQEAAAQSGIDPVTDPQSFLEVVDPILQQEPLVRTRLLGELARIQKEFAPELPAGAQNLAFRAREAGLEEGTEDYRQFMLSGGELPEQEGEDVRSSARYRDKQTGDTLTLVRTNRGLARQEIGPDGKPEYQYVSGDRYERVSAQEAGQPGSFEADFSDLASRRNVTLSFIEQADQLSSEITPETVGLPGAVARGLSSLSSQVQGSFRAAFGSRLEAPTDVSSYTDTFENLGLSEQSAEIKAALVDLAVTKAYLDQGGTGDVRKNEVERALETVRAGSGDPQQIRAALGRLRERAARDFNIALDTATRQSSAEAPFGPINLEPRTTETAPQEGTESRITADSVSNMSISELQSLAQDENNFPTDPAIIQAIDDRLNQLTSNLERENRRRGTGAR